MPGIYFKMFHYPPFNTWERNEEEWQNVSDRNMGFITLLSTFLFENVQQYKEKIFSTQFLTFPYGYSPATSTQQKLLRTVSTNGFISNLFYFCQ